MFGATVFLYVVPKTEEALMSKKKEMLREIVRSVVGLLDTYEKQVESGRMDEKEAKTRALARIREMRYGPEGKDYFWINDLSPRMVMHPYVSDLEGKSLRSYRDSKGLPVFMEMAKPRLAKRRGIYSLQLAMEGRAAKGRGQIVLCETLQAVELGGGYRHVS